MTTKIEWLRSSDGRPGYSINPVKGLCPMACPYCYARRMYKRFGWNPEIRFVSDAMDCCLDIKAGSKVFVGSTIELFGDWVKEEWLKSIFGVAELCPDITFIFLTKKPENLVKWSPFPPNAYIGVSVTNHTQVIEAHHYLSNIQARVKFLSIEPLLEWHTHSSLEWLEEILAGISWIIIGQQTPISKHTEPKKKWIQEIVRAADRAKIPVFLKDNLSSLLPFQQYFEYGDNWKDVYKLRQEFPEVKG